MVLPSAAHTEWKRLVVPTWHKTAQLSNRTEDQAILEPDRASLSDKLNHGCIFEDHGTGPDALTKGSGTSHAFRVLDGAPLVYAVVLFAPIEIDGVRFPPPR